LFRLGIKMPPIKRKSEVWKYFSKTSDGFAECRFCNKKLKTSGNTSNLICHIARVHKNHTRTWTHTREEQNDVGQQSDADDTHSTASSASLYPTSTRRHGNFAGVHTLLRIILSSNSAVLINIITGVSPPHFDFFVFYVLCQC
jgi:hypothetical protein